MEQPMVEAQRPLWIKRIKEYGRECIEEVYNHVKVNGKVTSSAMYDILIRHKVINKRTKRVGVMNMSNENRFWVMASNTTGNVFTVRVEGEESLNQLKEVLYGCD